MIVIAIVNQVLPVPQVVLLVVSQVVLQTLQVLRVVHQVLQTLQVHPMILDSEDLIEENPQ